MTRTKMTKNYDNDEKLYLPPMTDYHEGETTLRGEKAQPPHPKDRGRPQPMAGLLRAPSLSDY
jgi:hypothetical protein